MPFGSTVRHILPRSLQSVCEDAGDMGTGGILYRKTKSEIRTQRTGTDITIHFVRHSNNFSSSRFVLEF